LSPIMLLKLFMIETRFPSKPARQMSQLIH
jgi:hypothetical protein